MRGGCKEEEECCRRSKLVDFLGSLARSYIAVDIIVCVGETPTAKSPYRSKHKCQAYYVSVYQLTGTAPSDCNVDPKKTEERVFFLVDQIMVSFLRASSAARSFGPGPCTFEIGLTSF